MENEATVIGPMIANEKRGRNIPATVMALAASVVGVAIFSWSNFATKLESPLKSTVAARTVESPAAVQKVQLAKVPEAIEVPKRLNDYLITHDESTYSSGTQTMLPYARVVSYSSSE